MQKNPCLIRLWRPEAECGNHALLPFLLCTKCIHETLFRALPKKAPMQPYQIMLLTALVTGFGGAVGKNLASILSHIASLVLSSARGKPELMVDLERAGGTGAEVSLFRSEDDLLEVRDFDKIEDLVADELEPAAEAKRADAWRIIARNFWARVIEPGAD